MDHQATAGTRAELRYAFYDVRSPNARGVGGLNDVSRGTLVVVWDEVVTAKRRIALARATVGRSSVSFDAPAILSDGESSVYPIAAAVPDGVLVAWTSGSPDASTIVVRRITTSGTE